MHLSNSLRHFACPDVRRRVHLPILISHPFCEKVFFFEGQTLTFFVVGMACIRRIIRAWVG